MAAAAFDTISLLLELPVTRENESRRADH